MKVIINYSNGDREEYRSCTEASEALGVSPAVLSRWITGRNKGYMAYNIDSIYRADKQPMTTGSGMTKEEYEKMCEVVFARVMDMISQSSI